MFGPVSSPFYVLRFNSLSPQVFEVFGPVSSPFYVLRFNSESDIAERGVKLKDSMFYAPSLTDYTLYILTEQLRKSLH